VGSIIDQTPFQVVLDLLVQAFGFNVVLACGGPAGEGGANQIARSGTAVQTVIGCSSICNWAHEIILQTLGKYHSSEVLYCHEFVTGLDTLQGCSFVKKSEAVRSCNDQADARRKKAKSALKEHM
jgi:hypothetical protein